MTDQTDSIPFFKPSFSEAEERAVLEVLRSGWLTTGKVTLAFEKEFAGFVGSPHALAVNSATSGLMLAMEALGVGPGTKILTTPYTFASTATSARHLGAEVVYADLEDDTYSINPARVDEELAKDASIRAVVPVHIAGNLCDMRAINEIARRRGVSVIEDAAHAFPSLTDDGFAGTLGDVGVYSFYATKTITTGEGGMVCTRDPEVAARVSLMRSHGIDRTVWDRYTSQTASWKYDVVDEGWKCNLPDILSAIGREQLKKANDFFRKRAAIAARFSAAFASVPGLLVPPDGPGNAWHLYLLRIDPAELDCDRDAFAAELQAAGLGISMHFIPHFELTYFRKRYGLSASDFPNANRRYRTTISLPFWPDMGDSAATRVIETVIAVAARHRKRT